ncbi:MAG: LamG domain-containing protein [Planctomycetales bacterium]
MHFRLLDASLPEGSRMTGTKSKPLTITSVGAAVGLVALLLHAGGSTAAAWADRESKPRPFDLVFPGDNATIHAYSPALQWQPAGNVKDIRLQFEKDEHDHITIPHNPDLNITDRITVSAWINSDEKQRGAFTFIAGKHMAYLLPFDHKAGVFRGAFAVHAGKRWLHSGGPANIPPGEKHLVVGVYDGESLITYVDGEKACSNKVGKIKIDGNDHDFKIGWDGGLSGQGYVKGTISDVRVYQRALSPEEINKLFKGNPVDAGGLVGRWNLDERRGQKIKDASGNGHDGMLGAEQEADVQDPSRVGVEEGVDHYEVWLNGKHAGDAKTTAYPTNNAVRNGRSSWRVVAVGENGEKVACKKPFAFKKEPILMTRWGEQVTPGDSLSDSGATFFASGGTMVTDG